MMLSKFKTEIIGISAEVAIADAFDVPVREEYRRRANDDVVSAILTVVPTVFAVHKIPRPVQHIAEDANDVDFALADGGTLSVKSNQRKVGKVAPQKIGQPTANTFWQYFRDFADGDIHETDDEESKNMFKRVCLARVDEMLSRYWANMFDCEYLIHFYDVIDSFGNILVAPQYVVFGKRVTPEWDKSKFTFTRPTLESWNEANTVKYCGVSIGEFQVHAHRNCFKFRFNMDGIVKLTAQGII
jgi:hypothetical protein